MIAYKHVALIGLGLLASSIARGLERAGFDGRVTGSDRNADVRASAAEIGLCEVKPTAFEAVAGADLVILATPVGAFGAVAAEICPHLAPGTTLSDVGSVKTAVMEADGPRQAPSYRDQPLVLPSFLTNAGVC